MRFALFPGLRIQTFSLAQGRNWATGSRVKDRMDKCRRHPGANERSRTGLTFLHREKEQLQVLRLPLVAQDDNFWGSPRTSNSRSFAHHLRTLPERAQIAFWGPLKYVRGPFRSG